MATVKQFIRRSQVQVERLWQNVQTTANEPVVLPVVLQKPNVDGKDSHMLKMGNREEKGVVFGAGQGQGMESGGSRPGASKETVIGENITIEGTVHAKEDIIMEGRIKGILEAKSHSITIGPKGHIEADVDAEDVVISGRMTGNIIAHSKVQITREADFTGSIKAKRIAIEDGAYIKATIELEKQERQTARTTDAIVFEGSGQAQKPVKGEPQSTKPA